MTQRDLTDLLERAADRTEVGAPPVDAMLRGVRRRRRRHIVLAGAGLTAATVATAILVPVLATPGQEDTPAIPLPSTRSTQSPAPSPPHHDVDLEGRWIVTALVRGNGKPARATYRGTRLHMSFRNGTIRAYDGCNELSGGYALHGARFNLKDDVASTLVGCLPPSPPLFGRLSVVHSVGRDQGGTYLKDADGNVVIALDRNCPRHGRC
jgi:heat shock protein HslJ